MKIFKFQATTKYIAGIDSLTRLGAEVKALGLDHVMIATDPKLPDEQIVSPVMTALTDAGIKVNIFRDVAPNPTDQTALDGAAVARETGAQAIVGVGGGSPIDAAKMIAVMATNDGPILDYCGTGANPWPMNPCPSSRCQPRRAVAPK